MSEETTEVQEQSELETLKARADKLGIKYHPSIGVEKLREKVNEKLEGGESKEEAPANETSNAKRLRKRREAEELVRVQITCMNPNKREWDGEMFTASNAVAGTHKKFVPFNVPWHVPRIILNQIKQRKCQVFVTRRDERGEKRREGQQITEFNVAELPALSEAELKELGQRQAMAAGQV